jgi:proteasome lid subunit RPN8/RPN11
MGMALAGYPDESCGLLIGRRSTEPDTLVEDVVQARNVNVERPGDRYELDPDAFAAADRAARERGLEIVGIWHSHPDHPAVPSATDRDRAWTGWSYLIASVGRGGVAELRSWRLHGEAFAEEVIAP